MSIRPSRNGLPTAAAGRLNAIRIVRAYSRFRELSDQEFAMLLDTIEEAFAMYPNKRDVYQ
jgi:hypothetical protein